MSDPCPCLRCALKAVESQAALLLRAAGPTSELQPELQQLRSLIHTAQEYAEDVARTARHHNTQADQLQSQVDTLESQVDSLQSQAEGFEHDREGSSSPNLLDY